MPLPALPEPIFFQSLTRAGQHCCRAYMPGDRHVCDKLGTCASDAHKENQ